jgi:ABC-type molybdate transport system substrate-binding protein
MTARRALALTLAAAALVGCGSSDERVTITVLAAASLGDAFAELEQTFEAA